MELHGSRPLCLFRRHDDRFLLLLDEGICPHSTGWQGTATSCRRRWKAGPSPSRTASSASPSPCSHHTSPLLPSSCQGAGRRLALANVGKFLHEAVNFFLAFVGTHYSRLSNALQGYFMARLQSKGYQVPSLPLT